MRVLVWHVHGSWTTSFVQGHHEYVLPLAPQRGPQGRGRAQTWDWPAAAREVPIDDLADTPFDVVVLQSREEALWTRQWTGRRPGRDVPAVYLEHNAPQGPVVASRHPVADDPVLRGIPLVHVTHFNALAWDNGSVPVTVIEHGIPDPGHRYTGTSASLAAAVNEPVRRRRVAGTDVLLSLAATVPTHVYGMATGELATQAGGGAVVARGNLPQAALHEALARHRGYLHPYRWTSLGLALVEAMTLGMPVLAVATTEAPRAVPADAGLVSCDIEALRERADRWMRDPTEARETGQAARRHALERYSLPRFLDDWDELLKEVVR